MLRTPFSLRFLGLLLLAGTCRSFVGEGYPTLTPEPTFTPFPTVEPTPTLAPPDFEVTLWPADGAPMVLIPGGDFTLGLDDSPTSDQEAYLAEGPAHKVYLDDFLIDRYEVTHERFGRFVADGGYYTHRYWTSVGWQWVQANQISAPPYWGRSDFGLPQQPVVGVTWYEAYAFCLWAGKRLPDEAEWEKAARGADERLYPWGDDWDCTLGNFDDEIVTTPGVNECNGGDGYNLTAPVGSYDSGQSPYHVHDMAGNVWEWTLGQPGPYPYAPGDGRNEPASDGTRIIRGASWLTYTGEPGGDNHARVTFRGELAPDSQSDRVGFRCIALAE
jgi:formylglycine-generating enzyme required for sulfatase activity